MLKEKLNVRQIPGETPRRWFSSDRLDLIVWQESGGELRGFQICLIDNPSSEITIIWNADNGVSSGMIDTGENSALDYKMTPVLSEIEPIITDDLVAAFEAEGEGLPEDIYSEISRRLEI